MNIKTWLCLALFVASLTLTGCRSKGAADSELAGIEAYAKAELTIEMMRQQNEPDWDAVREQYEIAAAIVKKYDQQSGLQYDAEIHQALDECAAGEQIDVNQQILAKGLQHVTVLAIMDELNGKDQAAAAARIKAYFEGIRPTFVRRDQDFFGGDKTLQAAADTALEHLAKAGAADVLTARRQIEDVIARTYGLCVLYEVAGIEKLRNTDLAKCEVKRTEGVIFYRIIEPRIQKRSPKTAEAISAMLNGNYETMDSAAVEEYLETGLAPVRLK